MLAVRLESFGLQSVKLGYQLSYLSLYQPLFVAPSLLLVASLTTPCVADYIARDETARDTAAFDVFKPM